MYYKMGLITTFSRSSGQCRFFYKCFIYDVIHEYLHLTRLASYPFVLASYRKNREVTLHFLYTVTDEIQWNICVLCAYITTIIPNLSGGAREADFPKGVN